MQKTFSSNTAAVPFQKCEAFEIGRMLVFMCYRERITRKTVAHVPHLGSMKQVRAEHRNTESKEQGKGLASQFLTLGQVMT